MKFTIFQETRTGARKSNQDRLGYTYSREALLLIVADGMGGHLHGEVAAQIAVQYVTEAFQREARPKIEDPFLFLLKGITSAHHAILDYAGAKDLQETPRTTCVACLVQDSVAYWAHVGDSRLYHLRQGRVQAVTKDHSRVQMLVDQGRIREESVAAHPDRNKIYNCLGSESAPQVDLSRKTVLEQGDTLLLCSDGLWGPLSAALISAALLNKGQPGSQLSQDELARAVSGLMDQAELRAGRECDNVSVVAMNWLDHYTGKGAAGEVSTQTLELGEFSSQVDPFGKAVAANKAADLTDAEIERAITEIRKAIRKQSPK